MEENTNPDAVAPEATETEEAATPATDESAE